MLDPLQRACPLCRRLPEPEGSRWSDFSGRAFHYGRCTACELGLVLDPREDYAALYDGDYYDGRGADPTVDYVSEMRSSRTVRELEWAGLTTSLKPDRSERVLDFGCGLGGLVRHLAGGGWDAVGFEEEGFARDYLRTRNIAHLDALKDQHFDVVFAVEVVEHLVDPLPVLQAVRDVLRPGGRLLITTGNLARARQPLNTWRYSSVPEVHVTFWSPRSWEEALRRTGFVPDASRRLSPSVTQYKVLKSLPEIVHAGGLRMAPLWRPVARTVDRLYGVSEFAQGFAAK